MVTKEQNQELFDSQIEAQELAMQLADMLGAALYFAGVRKDKMQEAVDAYLNAIDEVFEDDPEGEMGFEEIIKVIKHLQKTKKHLFR
ncbi:MAG: hypothetical protein GXO31_06110 [Epsilonproteobacteria bacterium]|nr:hypothetical protein [Campylobacterota bacterium]